MAKTKKKQSDKEKVPEVLKIISRKVGEDSKEKIEEATRKLGFLTVSCGEINRENGFLAPTNVDTRDNTIWMMAILALITSEIGEAVEALRMPDRKKAREAFEEEVADIIIRILHMAYFLGMDVHKAVEKKLAKIQERDYLHGKFL